MVSVGSVPTDSVRISASAGHAWSLAARAAGRSSAPVSLYYTPSSVNTTRVGPWSSAHWKVECRRGTLGVIGRQSKTVGVEAPTTVVTSRKSAAAAAAAVHGLSFRQSFWRSTPSDDFYIYWYRLKDSLIYSGRSRRPDYQPLYQSLLTTTIAAVVTT